MHSLQVKFSALVIALLVVACVSLALIATEHERQSLEAEVEKHGRALTAHLAGAAKGPLLFVEQGDFGGELDLERLIEEVRMTEGVVAARLLDREGRVVTALDSEERGQPGQPRTQDGPSPDAQTRVERSESLLLFAAPILYSGVRMGEAQVVFDLTVLVDPVVRNNRDQLTATAVALLAVGVVAGMVFVALLVNPLKRLRHGVEQMSAGNVMVRVPPTSHDEVGELTRAFNEMGDSLAQKQRVQNAFGRYVNDYVLSQLLQGSEGDEQAGIEREVTILFADIRSFTRLSEGMDAPDVVALLNEVFQAISDRILEQGGTIDKFIGDSVMAYFGAPVPHADHALCAVNAAVQIIETIAERNRVRRSAGPGEPKSVPVEIGIGVHLGQVVVGNIGSDRRTDFTAVGDAVNVAHRLEKLARPGEILVSEAVQRCVRGGIEMRFEGERQLSGREEPVHVYSVQLDDNRSEPAHPDSLVAL
ncbi:MAG: adenylate/guanylate cyclase domain-containing protein [Myxococcota bacterium]